jgi:hypothetical protein
MAKKEALDRLLSTLLNKKELELLRKSVKYRDNKRLLEEI